MRSINNCCYIDFCVSYFDERYSDDVIEMISHDPIRSSLAPCWIYLNQSGRWALPQCRLVRENLRSGAKFEWSRVIGSAEIDKMCNNTEWHDARRLLQRTRIVSSRYLKCSNHYRALSSHPFRRNGQLVTSEDQSRFICSSRVPKGKRRRPMTNMCISARNSSERSVRQRSRPSIYFARIYNGGRVIHRVHVDANAKGAVFLALFAHGTASQVNKTPWRLVRAIVITRVFQIGLRAFMRTCVCVLYVS